MCKTFTQIDNFTDEMLFGKIVEISGANNSYKTSCVLSIARSILNNSKDTIILYIDCDSHLRQKYLNDYSIDIERFIVVNMSDKNDILELIQNIVSENIGNIVIFIDTVSSLKLNTPYRELKSFIIKLIKIIYNKNVAVFAINQYRYNPKIKAYDSFCAPCFEMYSSLRMNIVKVNQNDLILKISKNKITGEYNYPVIIDIGKTNAN